jgi:DNA-binding transcriptional LysR family regulator
VFFGSIMEAEVFPTMREGLSIRKITETALSMAAMQCALAGIGVAWIPSSLFKSELSNNRLINLSNHLPVVQLSVMAVRLNESKSDVESQFWKLISNP